MAKPKIIEKDSRENSMKAIEVDSDNVRLKNPTIETKARGKALLSAVAFEKEKEEE